MMTAEVPQTTGAKRLFKLLWDSPTLTTWGSFLARSGSLLIVLPLILNRFSAAELSLWYVFTTIIGMQVLFDLGFGSTFARAIAFAMGGATNLREFRSPQRIQQGTTGPNWVTVEAICAAMRKIYRYLAVLSLILVVVCGTLTVIRPISHVTDKGAAWWSWGVVAACFVLSLWGNQFSNYLQGINQIALMRRWEIFSSLAAILTSSLVLLWHGGLLGLVVANQGWFLFGTARNYWLCRKVEGGRFCRFSSKIETSGVFADVWPSAWRSGLGVMMSNGVLYASSLVYAQVGAVAQVASYLFALRLIQTVSQFSQGPFYSKLPLLARLRSEGQLDLQVLHARRGMRLSLWSFAIGAVLLGVMSKPLLALIHSHASFVAPQLWALISLSYFVERFGAMHIQLYSTTNHIIWHIANGISGIIFVGGAYLLFPFCGVYAFPCAMILAYAGFYSWYAARHSYRAFDLMFPHFELSVSIPPLLLLLAYGIWSISQGA